MTRRERYSLETLRLTRVSPLERIRNKNYTATELRRQASVLRGVYQFDFAQLLEDEALRVEGMAKWN